MLLDIAQPVHGKKPYPTLPTPRRRRTQDLKQDGYDVGELPADEGALMQSVLNDPTARYNSADLNVAYKMSVNEYQRLCPFADALEENWGKPPGAARGAIAFLRPLPALCFLSPSGNAAGHVMSCHISPVWRRA